MVELDINGIAAVAAPARTIDPGRRVKLKCEIKRLNDTNDSIGWPEISDVVPTATSCPSTNILIFRLE
jgi:hypothetical protein